LRRRCLALAANVIAAFAAHDVVTLNAKICPGAQAVATKMSEGNERLEDAYKSQSCTLAAGSVREHGMRFS
jgi:hypothetical protein